MFDYLLLYIYNKLMENTVCFTGHRPQHLPFSLTQSEQGLALQKKLKEVIKNLIENGYKNFISGMAIGIDMLCAQIVLDYKAHYDINFWCYLPCHNQDKLWNRKEKALHSQILQKADKILYAVDKNYCTGCTQLRNKMMVDDSNLVLAVYYEKSGGTRSTIEYAKLKGKQIIFVK